MKEPTQLRRRQNNSNGLVSPCATTATTTTTTTTTASSIASDALSTTDRPVPAIYVPCVVVNELRDDDDDTTTTDTFRNERLDTPNDGPRLAANPWPPLDTDSVAHESHWHAQFGWQTAHEMQAIVAWWQQPHTTGVDTQPTDIPGNALASYYEHTTEGTTMVSFPTTTTTLTTPSLWFHLRIRLQRLLEWCWIHWILARLEHPHQITVACVLWQRLTTQGQHGRRNRILVVVVGTGVLLLLLLLAVGRMASRPLPMDEDPFECPAG